MSIDVTIQGGTSKRLLTAGKYCPEDIVVTAESGGSAGLPYEPRHYVESDGEAYINTWYVMQEGDVVECDYELLDLSAGGDKMLFGAAGGNAGRVQAETYGSNNTWYVRAGSSTSKSVVWNSNQQRGTIVIGQGVFWINGAEYTVAYTGVPTLPIVLFGRNDPSTVQYRRVMRCEGFRIFKADGTIVVHLVPCVYNGTAGMWDKVSNQFHGNEGEGTLVVSDY